MAISELPHLNVCLNGMCLIMLLVGYWAIKNGKRKLHKIVMLAAVSLAALFLTSYLYHHYHVGSIRYPLHDWTRPLYFAILIPHTILAALLIPGIICLLWFAGKANFNKHRKLAKKVWPIWVFVSITGIIIYLMLFSYAKAD